MSKKAQEYHLRMRESKATALGMTLFQYDEYVKSRKREQKTIAQRKRRAQTRILLKQQLVVFTERAVASSRDRLNNATVSSRNVRIASDSSSCWDSEVPSSKTVSDIALQSYSERDVTMSTSDYFIGAINDASQLIGEVTVLASSAISALLKHIRSWL
jgi:hypothetical protein